MSEVFNASNTGNIDIPFFSDRETQHMLRHLNLSTHRPVVFHLSAISSWGLYNVSKKKIYFYATGDKAEKPFETPAVYSTYDGIVYAFGGSPRNIEEELKGFLMYSIGILENRTND